MTKRLLAAAFIYCASVLSALAQQGIPYFPQSLQSGTVVGRLSSGPGPTEAITFQQLLNQLFPGGSAAYNFNAASVLYQGSVSGAVTTRAQAAAGTWTLLWPTTVGTSGYCFGETVSATTATAAWTDCAKLSANNTFTGNNTFNGSATQNGLFNATGTFQWHSTTQTFPASGAIVGTTDIQTLTNKSIDAGQLSGTISTARLPAGINANNTVTKTANYTIASGDCGKTVSGTGGPWTMTLPAVAGFAATCVVQVCNADANDNTHHAILLSGFPTPSFGRLWMQQCEEVAINNGAWIATKLPGRFRPGFTPTLYVDTGGSDSNDGLVSNAAANALLTVQKCWDLFKSEIELSTNAGALQPVCSPTGGQTFTGGVNCVSMGSTSVYFLIGNGGRAVLRNTAGNVVVQQSDFCGYIILDNVNLDCTSAASHPCTGLFLHQQGGTDLSTSGFTNGVTFTGANAADIGVQCDAQCRVNTGAAITATGTFASVFTLNQGSSLNLSSGITVSASATIASLLILNSGTQAAYSGTITYGAGSTVSETFTLRGNGTYLCVGTMATSGVASGRQWSVLNGAALMNLSATAVPGSAGIAAAGTFGNGTIFAATGGGGC